MMAADKARKALAVRVLTGLAMLVVVAPSYADTAKQGRAPAPIIYAQTAKPQPIVRFENSIEARPVSAPVQYGQPAAAPLIFDQFQGRSTGPAAPLDLRPGATMASFSPVASAPVFRAPEELRPPAVKPLPAISRPMAWAEPYAGPPYQVEGKWYVPTHEPNYDEVGIASWYGPNFHGKASATGEMFDEMAMTAAHPTLPIPSLVRVTNLSNGKSVVVRLNDRGPFVDDRIIDMSKGAAVALEMTGKGTAKVRVQYVGPAPADANALPPKATLASAPQTSVKSVEPESYVQPTVIMTSAPEVRPLAPVSAPSASSAEARGFYLQAGSFSDLGNAHALRDRLKDMGSVTVTAAQVNGAEYYRVMVGPWASRTEAERAQGRLIEQGAKAIVVARLDN